MPIITITRAEYSGGEDIAQIVANELGAKCIQDEVLREAASNFHVPEQTLAQTFESNPTLWERITKSRHVHAAYIQAVLVGWCVDNNLVYHGNAGQELLRDIPHVLKVRTMLSHELRVQRIMDLLGQTRQQAERTVYGVDADRTKRMRYYYDADWRDPSRFDLLIRTDHLEPGVAARIILEMAAQPAYQMTDEQAVQLQNIHLQSQLYALAAAVLGSRLNALELVAQNGEVTLKGEFSLTDAMMLDRLVVAMKAAPGVTKVSNQMSAGLAVFAR